MRDAKYETQHLGQQAAMTAMDAFLYVASEQAVSFESQAMEALRVPSLRFPRNDEGFAVHGRS